MAKALKEKYATRTVLLDSNGKVAIINVKNHGYYKIPGGGVEANEEVHAAAKREVAEEAGCNCEIIASLGRLPTKIPVWGMLDISDGFIAKVIGKKSKPTYEAWEAERGFTLEWFDNLDSAIKTIEQHKAREPGMDSLQQRDLSFLRIAKNTLSQGLTPQFPTKPSTPPPHNKHIKNIFCDRKLDDVAVVSSSETTTRNGKKCERGQ